MKGSEGQITVDFSVEVLKAGRSWSNASHVIQDSNDQPRLIYPAKLPAIVEERKTFHDISSLKNYIQQIKSKENTGSNASG